MSNSNIVASEGHLQSLKSALLQQCDCLKHLSQHSLAASHNYTTYIFRKNSILLVANFYLSGNFCMNRLNFCGRSLIHSLFVINIMYSHNI